MANTFTSNYSLVRSEIGGDNQNWGANLHTSLNTIDAQLINKVDKDNLKGFTSTAIVFTNTGASEGTISAASGDLFEDFEIGDRIRVTGATSDTNGSTSSPSIHTVTNKSNSNSITVSTGLFTASDGATVTIGLVLEPDFADIDAGEIDNAPIGANTASTGAFTTLTSSGNTTVSGDLSVTGNSTLTGNTTVNGNTTLGNASTDTVTSNAKHGATTFTGQITSEVADGTPPFVVASTSSVANLKAEKADQWSTTRTIQLTGAVTSSATDIDGSGNVSIATTLADPVYSTGTLSNFLYEGSTQVTSGPSTYTCNYTRIGRVYHVDYHVVWNAGIGASVAYWTFVLPAGITSDQGQQPFRYYSGASSGGGILPAPTWQDGLYYLRASDDRLVIQNSSGSALSPRTVTDTNTFVLNITYQAI